MSVPLSWDCLHGSFEAASCDNDCRGFGVNETDRQPMGDIDAVAGTGFIEFSLLEEIRMVEEYSKKLHEPIC